MGVLVFVVRQVHAALAPLYNRYYDGIPHINLIQRTSDFQERMDHHIRLTPTQLRVPHHFLLRYFYSCKER